MKWGINWKVLSEQTDKGFSVPTVQSTNHLCCSRRNYESHIFVSDAAPPPLPPPAPHTRSSITGTYIQICRPGLPAFSSLASVLNHIAALFELITRTNNAPLCSSCAVWKLHMTCSFDDKMWLFVPHPSHSFSSSASHHQGSKGDCEQRHGNLWNTSHSSGSLWYCTTGYFMRFQTLFHSLFDLVQHLSICLSNIHLGS